ADSHGYQDDGLRTMWPWRDWVIHAFNENYPYDKFVMWQLAGDLIPEATKESILATGFNRNHKITQEGGVIDEEYRVEYVTDRTNTFGKERTYYAASPEEAEARLSVGEYPRKKTVDPVETAALMQVVATLYNMDEAITR